MHTLNQFLFRDYIFSDIYEEIEGSNEGPEVMSFPNTETKNIWANLFPKYNMVIF